MANTTRQPRRRLRKLGLIATLLGVAFFIWAGYWAIWACTVSPTIAVDYGAQMEQLSHNAQPPGANGWDDIMRALTIRAELESAFPAGERPGLFDFRYHLELVNLTEDQALLFHSIEPGQPYEEMNAIAHEALDWLDENGAWDAIQQARAQPNIVMPIASSPVHPNFGIPMSAMRDIARARAVCMDFAIRENDIPAATRALEDIFTLADAMHHQPFVISYLVGAAIHSMPVERIRVAVTRGGVSPEMIEGLLEVVHRNPPLADVSLQLEGDRRYALDIIQSYYSDDGNGDGTLLYALAAPNLEDPITGVTGGAPLHPVANVIGVLYASRRDATDVINNYFDLLLQEAVKPAHEQADVVLLVRSRFLSLSWRYAPVTMLFSAHPCVDMPGVNIMRTEGAKIILALELYRHAHGELPTSLDVLAPKFLPVVPIDPVSAQPFVYCLLDDDPHGRDYILYSVGYDGVDNNGAEVQYPPSLEANDRSVYTGSDFVINHPLEE